MQQTTTYTEFLLYVVSYIQNSISPSFVRSRVVGCWNVVLYRLLETGVNPFGFGIKLPVLADTYG